MMHGRKNIKCLPVSFVVVYVSTDGEHYELCDTSRKSF